MEEVSIEQHPEELQPPDTDSSMQESQSDYCNTPAPTILYDFTQNKDPALLNYACSEFGSHFTKGCKWSPDGSRLLVSSDDRRLKVFSLPEQFYTGDFSAPVSEMTADVNMKEGGTIYDYCWNPAMSAYDSSTCFCLSTVQSAPIHMWDTQSGSLRSTYKAINNLDELDSCKSIAISPDMRTIYAGFDKKIYLFDINIPGRQVDMMVTHTKKSTGQTGIISCFAFMPLNQTFAAGSYSKTVAIYDERTLSQTMIFEGHAGGITHLIVTNDEYFLISGARKDNELLVWDIRNPGKILSVLSRDVRTNQRIYFDTDYSSRYVCSGNQNGTVSIWDLHTIDFTSEDLEQNLNPILNFPAHSDCVNGCSLHPLLAMVATSSGQRSYTNTKLPYSSSGSDSESDTEMDHSVIDNSIKLWWLGP